jgi:hypothetical protein
MAESEDRSSGGGTALDALLDLIEWCRSERSNLQRQLCALNSGKFRIGENNGTGWVDTTGTNINRISAAISDLDQILAAYERSSPRSDPRAVKCSRRARNAAAPTPITRKARHL